MKPTAAFAATLLVSLAASAAPPSATPALAEEAAAPNLRMAMRQSSAVPASLAAAHKPMPPLPPLPEGVTDLKFGDFYKLPVGPMGLEFSEKILALQGKKVRIGGFQVAEMVSVCNAEPNGGSPARKMRAMLEASVPGRLLVAPLPESVSFGHTGLCEDLPPQVVYVSVPELFGQPVPQHHGPLLLIGTLEVGNKPEPDGRVSSVRLKLDPASPSLSASPSPAASHSPITATNTTK